MNRRQAANIAPAIAFADTTDRPLNWFVTINFSHTACAAEDVSRAFERLRDNHFTRWLRYRSQKPFRRDYGEPTYVWVIENASGHTHVHWMVHVPRALIREFKIKAAEWVATVSATSEIPAGTLHIEPVDRPTGLGKYVLKGIDPRIAARHRIEHQSQGIVVGKRCGVSNSLGATARERHRLAVIQSASPPGNQAAPARRPPGDTLPAGLDA